MLNIGPQELLLILVLALLVVGPKRLPELGRSLGKGLRELRKAQDEVRKTIQVNLDEDETAKRTVRRPKRLPVDAAASEAETPDASPTAAEAEATSGGDLAAPAAAAGSVEASGVSEISRSLGRSLAELRRAREEVQRSFRVDLDPSGSSRPVVPAARATTSSSESSPTRVPDEPAPSPLEDTSSGVGAAPDASSDRDDGVNEPDGPGAGPSSAAERPA